MDSKNSKNTATKNNVLNVEENYNVNGFATMSAEKAYAVRYDDKILVTDSLGQKNHYTCYNAANLSDEEKVYHRELIDELSNLEFHIKNDTQIDRLFSKKDKERQNRMIKYFVRTEISSVTFISSIKLIAPDRLDRLRPLVEKGFPVLEKIKKAEVRLLNEMKLNNKSAPEDKALTEMQKSQLVYDRANKVLDKFYYSDKYQKSVKDNPHGDVVFKSLMKHLEDDRIDINYFLQQMEDLSGYSATAEDVNHLVNFLLERRKYEHIPTGPATPSARNRLQMKRKQECFKPEVQSKMIKLWANTVKRGTSTIRAGARRTARVGPTGARRIDFNNQAEVQRVKNEGSRALHWVVQLGCHVGKNTVNTSVPNKVQFAVDELLQGELGVDRFIHKLKPILDSAKFDCWRYKLAAVLNALMELKRRGIEI